MQIHVQISIYFDTCRYTLSSPYVQKYAEMYLAAHERLHMQVHTQLSIQANTLVRGKIKQIHAWLSIRADACRSRSSLDTCRRMQVHAQFSIQAEKMQTHCELSICTDTCRYTTSSGYGPTHADTCILLVTCRYVQIHGKFSIGA
jgi:hypothetical protein